MSEIEDPDFETGGGYDDGSGGSVPPPPWDSTPLMGDDLSAVLNTMVGVLGVATVELTKKGQVIPAYFTGIASGVLWAVGSAMRPESCASVSRRGERPKAFRKGLDRRRRFDLRGGRRWRDSGDSERKVGRCADHSCV